MKYSQVASSPALARVTQWRRFEIGFIPFHGTSLDAYQGSAAPAAKDPWIDDLVIDNERVGCLR